MGQREFLQKIPEMYAFIDRNTKSVDVMDKFEGIGEGRKYYYTRLVDINPFWHDRHACYFYLVFYRSISDSMREKIGDITFTEYKTGKNKELIDYIKSEITDEVYDRFCDREKFYQLSKMYRFRAQNSHNLSGYGWRWTWINGYEEGTYYGETTSYVISAVYIASGPESMNKKVQKYEKKMKERECGAKS